MKIADVRTIALACRCDPPYASAAGVRAVLQFLVAGQPKAATANPEEFYDNSFLKRIDDGGFTKSFVSRR